MSQQADVPVARRHAKLRELLIHGRDVRVISGRLLYDGKIQDACHMDAEHQAGSRRAGRPGGRNRGGAGYSGRLVKKRTVLQSVFRRAVMEKL